MNSEEPQTQKQEQQPEQEPAIEALDHLQDRSARVDLVAELPEDDLVVGDRSPLTTEQNNQLIEGDSAPIDDKVQKKSDRITELEARVAELKQEEQSLKQEIASLQTSRKILSEQMTETQATLGRLLQEGLSELEQRKQTLQIAVEQLERRQERVRSEMKTTFAGVSQDLAIRVQGFKDYLVGSLQDLASSAEQLELIPKAPEPEEKVVIKDAKPIKEPGGPKFAEQGFQEQSKQIRKLLDQYRTRPDYYGPPWQLRRTFEPVHAERASYWFSLRVGRARCGLWVLACKIS